MKMARVNGTNNPYFNIEVSLGNIFVEDCVVDIRERIFSTSVLIAPEWVYFFLGLPVCISAVFNTKCNL